MQRQRDGRRHLRLLHLGPGFIMFQRVDVGCSGLLGKIGNHRPGAPTQQDQSGPELAQVGIERQQTVM